MTTDTKENNSIQVFPPLVESFLNLELARTIWPKNIFDSYEFRAELRKRRDLILALNRVTKKIPEPKISFECAIQAGHVEEKEIAELYYRIVEFLEDRDHARIVLYIPFEFLPSKNWKPKSQDLARAISKFQMEYWSAWLSIIRQHDVRANFVDGDVPDIVTGTENPPRVVKAAHMIPVLVERGILIVEEAILLMESIDDEVLRKSVADTIPMLYKMGHIKDGEILRLKSSDNSDIRNAAKVALEPIDNNSSDQGASTNNESLLLVVSSLQNKLLEIERKNYGDITTKRADWLRSEERNAAIKLAGEEIALMIAANSINDLGNSELDQAAKNEYVLVSLIRGIGRALELINPEEAARVYKRYEHVLSALYNRDSNEIQNEILRILSHLYNLGIVDASALAELNIALPALSGPFSENLRLMSNELDSIKKIAESIQDNSELSPYLYPAVIVFGSRLKGYGTKGTDTDMAVFVREGTPIHRLQELRKLVHLVAEENNIKGEIVEFWLKEDGGNLRIDNSNVLDSSFGKSYWAHVLFGGAWVTNQDTIRYLAEKLLVPYLYNRGETIYDQNTWTLHLNEIERDSLLCRLLQKGYEKFFAPCGEFHYPHMERIDGKSMFWDSGYRLTATKLFLNRVFIPKLK